jgi:hypothetical protein
MPRLAIFNMFLGFFVLTLVAAAGSFIATDITVGYLQDQKSLETWRLLIAKSSHGHTNLFAMIHIMFGLTMPYSKLSNRVKKIQTIGLFLGVLGMGPVMLMRGYLGPVDRVDLVEVCLGTMLSCALLSLVSHAAGLGMKWINRES